MVTPLATSAPKLESRGASWTVRLVAGACFLGLLSLSDGEAAVGEAAMVVPGAAAAPLLPVAMKETTWAFASATLVLKRLSAMMAQPKQRTTGVCVLIIL